MIRRFWSDHGLGRLAGATAWLLLAACRNEPGQERTITSNVAQAYDALSSEVATCAQGVAVCIQDAQQDVVLVQGCYAELEGCTVAGQGAVDDLTIAASTCAAEGRACVETAAADLGALQACREELASCLGADTPVPGTDPNDDDDGDTCIVGLTGCIQAGDSIPACVQGVRACVLGAVPWPGGLGAIDDDDDTDEADEQPGSGDPGTPGAGAEGAAAAIDCLQLLGACLADTGDPTLCLDDARACKDALDDE